MAQRLARLARHVHRRLEGAVSGLRRGEHVATGKGQEAGADPHGGPASAQGHRLRLGRDRHPDRGHPREDADDHGGEGDEPDQQQRARAHAPPTGGLRAGRPRRVADGRDRRALSGRALEALVARRGDEHDGRLRGVRIGERLDHEVDGVRPEPHLDPRRLEAQDVAVAQPVRRGEAHAVAQDGAPRRGLDEDLAVGHPQPGQRPGTRGDRHHRSGAAERHRELRRREGPGAAALLDPERRQIASSQRTTTVGAGDPGAIVNCRLTSR